MSTTCPANTIDEHAARFVAGIVVIFAALSLRQPTMALIVFLALDFAIRGFGSRVYSPLRWVAKRIVEALGLEAKPVFAPPKQFAARIGAVMTAAAALLHLLGFHGASGAVIAMLLIAASLEALAGKCIACWLYPAVFPTRGASRVGR